MRHNPPWANRALKQNWNVIERTGLPLPIKGPGEWKFEELGCGHYGCVMPTSDENTVFKLTSDPTEAEFIKLAEPLGWPEGIVEYFAIVPLDFTFRKRDVFAIWRETAYNVGDLDPDYFTDPKNYEVRSRREFIDHLYMFKNHAARLRNQLKRSKNPSKLWAEAKKLQQWAWDNFGIDESHGVPQSSLYGGQRIYSAIDSQRGAYKIAASWRACEIIAETMEHTYLSDIVGGAFSFYLENGFLLADVHAGNIGQVKREDTMPWAITDPGHVVVLG